MTQKPFFVHPTAIVDEGASIGAGSKIWHFCHLMPRCTIGLNCTVGQNVFIDNDVTVGNGVKIQNNVSLYKGVEIEDDVFLGPSMVFTNVINPRSFIERKNEFKKTIIRRGATVGANATIVCGAEVGQYALIAAGAVITKDVPAYALLMGVPGRIKGWVSEAGHTLQFNDDNIAACPQTGQQYRLKNGLVEKI